MDLVGTVIAPEHRLEIRVRDLEVSPRLRGLEEATICVQRFGPSLLENDPSAKLAIQRAVDLPLANEGPGDPVTCGAGFLGVASVFLGKRVQAREELVQGLDLRGPPDASCRCNSARRVACLSRSSCREARRCST